MSNALDPSTTTARLLKPFLVDLAYVYHILFLKMTCKISFLWKSFVKNQNPKEIRTAGKVEHSRLKVKKIKLKWPEKVEHLRTNYL